MDTDRYFDIGLPQLPTNIDPRIEPDLRDLYNSLRALTYLTGQRLGLETPLSRYQRTDEANYTIGDAKRRVYVSANDTVTYGELVNLNDVAGVLRARRANATDNTKPAHGICNTLGTCVSGATIEIVLPGAYITSVGGMTRGVIYYTSTTPGAIQNLKPAVVGNIVQAAGVAISPTELFFNLSYLFEDV